MSDAMTDRLSMKSLGRRAGVLYLLQCLPAPFALVFVPGRILVAGDIAATAEHVRAHAGLLRVSMVAEIFSCLMIVFTAIAIYRLLRRADQHLAVATAALMWISVPIQMLNILNHLAALTLTSGVPYLSAFSPQELNGLIYLFLRLHAKGLDIAQIFWGLWLIPWGLAVVRTAIMPRWIGVAIIVAGVGYMVDSTVSIAVPRLAPMLSMYLLALGAGEFPNMIYMLGWGAREPRSGGVRQAAL